jgi:hypothetical protein
VKFIETYSVADWQHILVEDAKLAREITASGRPVVSTKRPTLRYYLGGYSNNFAPDAPIYWGKPQSATMESAMMVRMSCIAPLIGYTEGQIQR